MAKTYRKNILRTFRATKSRFLAVFSIVALGVGFLAGLSATPVDMKNSMEQYMDDGYFYDLRVLSTLGLTDGDVQSLAAVEGVEAVQPAYSADLLVRAGEADTVVARAHSLPPEDGLNRLFLVEGRLPAASGECVVEAGANEMNRAFDIGDTFLVDPDNEDLESKLSVTEFTVVGIVHNTNYFSFEREPASVGNGTISLVFYIEPEDFAFEAYTEIYLSAAGARALKSLEEEYQIVVDAVAGRVESIADVRCQARYDEVTGDARAELDDGWQEYYDAVAEAEQELADAARELEEGRQKLIDGERDYQAGETDYADGLAELADSLRKITDGQEQLDAARRQLEEGQAAWEEGWQQFRDGEAALGEAKKKLDEGQRQYDEGKAAYEAALAELEAGEAALAQLQELVDSAQQLLNKAEAAAQPLRESYRFLCLLQEGTAETEELQNALIEMGCPAEDTDRIVLFLQDDITLGELLFPGVLLPDETMGLSQEGRWDRVLDWLEAQGVITPEQRAALEPIVTEGSLDIWDMYWSELSQFLSEERLQEMGEFLQALDDAQERFQGILDEYYAKAAALAEGRALLESKKGELDAGAAELAAGWAEYEAAGTALYEGKRQLEATQKTLEEGWAMLADKQLELIDAQRQIDDGRQKLADARRELDDARALIAENKQKLLDGEIEYADAKAEVDEKLADARRELEDGERELSDLQFPEWYVWDRSHNVSFSSFDANVDKLQAITTIFPIFFFLVAALVVSTTMTRMIEEERLQIGTMKALGYTQAEIMRKYLCYAAVAAVAGSVFGLAVGFFAFPTIIWSAYQIMYYMPVIATPWLADKVIFAGGSLILLTVGITAMACRQSLTEVPAALMLPRAPKAGKRILLERIGPLWRRMPFIWKVTFRNLLRYKKRFWMTVIGVAGCTALLVTGFGISDSLDSIITNQYDRVYHYDLTTAVASPEDTVSGEVYDYLFGPDCTASLTACTEKLSQHTAAGEAVDCYLTIPRDTVAFADFADLHERVSGKPVPLGEQGVVLTEKFASIMGVKAGDTVALENADGVQADFLVTGVCEHYVYNYVYMSAATYQAGFGAEPSWNCILTRLPEASQAARDAVSSRLLAMDAVQGISFTVDQMTTVLNMLGSIDAVVVLIIACAAALAFVVLYNLSNINIAERVKEIATIKVLGFYDREVDSYVNRESVALTLIGALFGLVLGIWLHRFIIVTVEVDAVMFGRDIAPRSFLYALVLTMLFSTVVNLVMSRRLRRISMVESMKAPE